MAQAKQSTEEMRTKGVATVHGAVSDAIVAVGDALSTMVHVTGDVGEELMGAVGRVGRSGIREAGGMLEGIAGGLRGSVDALLARRGGRRGENGGGIEPGDDRPTV
jgi:hypothetical protein